jgi:hypothetical protein
LNRGGENWKRLSASIGPLRRAQLMKYQTNCPGTAPLRNLAALIPLFFGNAASAELLGDQIKLITDAADRICNVVTANGSASSMDVQGEVKAELRGLASKLANAGISGSGKTG